MSSTGPGSRGGEPLFSVPHLVVFVVLWAIAQTLMVAVHHPEVLHGSQIDTDGYMRLVRVKLLLDGGHWFNAVIPRSNWPFGESQHWTRPLDVLIILIAIPFRLFMAMPSALAVAGALISPLCHLGICLAAVWVIRPIVTGEERFLAMPAVLVQMGIIGYGTGGRADHHALIGLLAILALGFWIRTLLDPDRHRTSMLAGVFAGLGVWVSPEALLPLGLLFVSGGFAWVLQGDRYVVANRRLAMGALAAIAAGIMIDKPPAAWFRQTFDQVSIAHVTMCLLGLVFWAVVPRLATRLQRRWASARDPVGWVLRGPRFGVGLVGVGIVAALMQALHPRFFRGPWVDVDPEVIRIWLSHVMELQPLFPGTPGEIGRFLLFLAPAFVLFPALLLWLRKESSPPMRLVWLLFIVWLLVTVPLAAVQLRFSLLSGMVLALTGVEFLRRTFGQIGRMPSHRAQIAARLGTMIGLFLGPIMLSSAADMVFAESVTADSEEVTADECSISRIAGVLNDSAGLGSEPQTIVTLLDFGPELLYRTRHRVLAGPYHRNAAGILAAYRILNATDPDRSHAIALQRQASLILLCPPSDSAYFGRNPGSLYRRLLQGQVPSWIRAIPVPPARAGAFRFFYVVEPPRSTRAGRLP